MWEFALDIDHDSVQNHTVVDGMDEYFPIDGSSGWSPEDELRLILYYSKQYILQKVNDIVEWLSKNSTTYSLYIIYKNSTDGKFYNIHDFFIIRIEDDEEAMLFRLFSEMTPNSFDFICD